MNPLARYTRWLHTKWPAGTVEKLPECDEHGRTNIPGVRIVGDLTGIPLLKFSSKSGVEAVRQILKEPGFPTGKEPGVLDLAIIGGGVSGISAAIEARRAGLDFEVFEATQLFSTVANFPKAKPIYTYPTGMHFVGGLQFTANVKESLLDEMEAQRNESGIEATPIRIESIERKAGEILLHHGDGKTTTRARRVIIGIGRSGNFRKLGVPGEELPKVYNRLFDPKEFAGKNVLVVGGGDTAMETTIALAACGANVTLSYRKKEFARPKPENLGKIRMFQRDTKPLGRVTLALGTQVVQIDETSVILKDETGSQRTIANDVVFSMIGRETPLDFFRRSGIGIRGEWTPMTWAIGIFFVLFCVFLDHFKGNHPAEFPVQQFVATHGWFPYNVPRWFQAAGGSLATWSGREGNLLYTIKRGLGAPSFYYTLAYSACVLIFGIRRIRRRQTAYVTWQTITLIAVQCLPLFILPEIVLPWAGHNGWFESGHPLRWIADQLFESYDGGLGHERAYWRAYGFILAFPLNVYNVFTDRPMWLWLEISFLQTFVLIPLLIRRWGKGAYCGWICSCGALAETLGDTLRDKMPHGPFWNRLNMLGQGVLGLATVILGLRIAGWIWPGTEQAPSWSIVWYHQLFDGIPFLNYSWSVDLFLSGILGTGLYFWFSGRVWCRFACPLAALMHIYARFSKYRIFAEKKKCISCNICTSVCHQGIDVMNFANKGMPMEDPECVRCSACVQQCPTGVLSFGRLDGGGEAILDKLPASPVQMRETRQGHEH